MKLDPTENKDSYKDQAQAREGMFERTIPVKGTFDVVNVKLQHQKVGKKGTRKLRIITHVLRVVKAERKDDADAMVGNTFGQDVWWNFKRDDGSLSFNAMRLNHLAMAHGQQEAFDPDDDDELIGVITGIPYRISIDVTTTEGKNGKTYYDVDVQEVKHLDAKTRKRYTSAPDWKQTVPSADERMLERADYSTKAKKKGGDSDQGGDPFDGGGESDDWADDDLPF